MQNRIYLVTIYKYYNYEHSILNAKVFDTLEEAIDFGKNTIKEYCYNIIFDSIRDEDLPEDITDNQLDSFINSDINIDYVILISMISKNRKTFNTSKELMEYFNNNIKQISNEELFDFLLSLIKEYNMIYNYNGTLRYTIISDQCPILEIGYSSEIDFNEEDCKKGIYVFKYEVRD